MKRRWGLIVMLLLAGSIGLLLAGVEHLAPSLSLPLAPRSLERQVTEIAGAIVAIVMFLAALAQVSGFSLRSLLEALRSRGELKRPSSREHPVRQVVIDEQRGVVLAGDRSKIEGNVIVTDQLYQIPVALTAGTPEKREQQAGELLLIQEWFYGRERELATVEAILDEESTGVRCICIWGFAGVGKSALLREVLRRANKRGFAVTGNRLFTAGPDESLADLARRVAGAGTLGPIHRSDYEVLSQFIAAHFTGKAVFGIDGFPAQDAKFAADLNWLLESARQLSRDITILTASRQRPTLKATLPIRYLQIKPFSKDELCALVDKWAHDKLLLRHMESVYLASRGYPQFVEYICRNVEIAQRIIQGESVEFDILKEVWSTIRDSDLREPIELFSVLSSYSREWQERLADGLILDWPAKRDQLVDRALIEAAARGVYKMHDLLGTYVFERIGASHKRRLHHTLGSYYSSGKDHHGLTLAFCHLVEAEDVEKAKEIHSELRDVIRSRPYSAKTETCVRHLIELIGDTDPESRARLLEGLGFMHNMGDAYEEAETELAEAAELYASLGDKEGEAWTKHGLGIVYRMTANFSQALRTFQATQRLFASMADLRGVAWALREQCEILKSLGEYEEAFRAAMQSRELSLSAGDEWGATASLRSIAELNMAQYRFRECGSDYEQALESSRELNDQMNEAYALDGIASLYRMLGMYSKAVEYSKEALRILPRIGDRAGTSYAQLGLGEGLRMLKRYEPALREYTSAMDIAKAIHHRDTELFITLGIAETARARGEYLKAQAACQESLEGAIHYGLRLVRGHSLLAMAEASRVRGAINEELYDQAMQVYVSLGSQWGIVHTLIGRTLCCARAGMHTSRTEYFQQARDISREFSLSAELQVLTDLQPNDLHPLCFPLR